MKILIEGTNSTITFGNNVRISASHNLPTNINALESTNITIGNRCLFSNSVEIHSSDYHGIYNYEGVRINNAKDIVIEDDVWVGLRAIILKGSIIKHGTVIGAGSLVSNKFDVGNVVLAGNPARIIKNNIVWNLERKNKMEP